VNARWLPRGALVGLGLVAGWLSLDGMGFLDGLARSGVAEIAADGWIGAFLFPLAIPLACVMTTDRSPVRAGLALGVLAPLALPHYFVEARFHPTSTVAFVAVAVACGVIAGRAVRRSSEPAAARVMLTSVVVGALLLGGVATLLWWPQGFSLLGTHPRALPTPHVALATVLLAGTLVDLRTGRTRALLWLWGAGVCLATAPHFGSVASGCMPTPGPLEWLPVPRLVPLALLLWAGPVARFLSAPRSARADHASTCPNDSAARQE
jgi:hypothetical protein